MSELPGALPAELAPLRLPFRKGSPQPRPPGAVSRQKPTHAASDFWQPDIQPKSLTEFVIATFGFMPIPASRIASGEQE